MSISSKGCGFENENAVTVESERINRFHCSICILHPSYGWNSAMFRSLCNQHFVTCQCFNSQPIIVIRYLSWTFSLPFERHCIIGLCCYLMWFQNPKVILSTHFLYRIIIIKQNINVFNVLNASPSLLWLLSSCRMIMLQRAKPINKPSLRVTSHHWHFIEYYCDAYLNLFSFLAILHGTLYLWRCNILIY